MSVRLKMRGHFQIRFFKMVLISVSEYSFFIPYYLASSSSIVLSFNCNLHFKYVHMDGGGKFRKVSLCLLTYPKS